MKCPGIEQVMDYIQGRLAGPDAERVAEHFASGCFQCAENRQWCERVRNLAASDDSLDPPPWVLKRVLNLFEQKRQRAVNRPGRAIASLVFDSFAHSFLSEVRLAVSANRTLLYRAGYYSIDLQISSTQASKVDLMGQVLRENETGFESVAAISIELSRQGQTVHTATADQFGAFTINGVGPGDYDMKIEIGEQYISVPKLPVTLS